MTTRAPFSKPAISRHANAGSRYARRWYSAPGATFCSTTRCPTSTTADQTVGCLDWSNEEVAQGKILKVKGMLKDCKLKCFRVRVSTHRTDDLVTNEMEPRDTAAAEHESSARWTIEPFPRERKQLPGVQACQCRLARSQRNHVALAVRAWTRLKQATYQTQKTVYQLK